MPEMNDIELLRRYVTEHDEAGFTLLVERYVGLVYSTAMRQVRDTCLAEEVTQAVFIILARKAHTFRPGMAVSGWLYRAARFAASDALKSNTRRLKREQEATQMDTNSADNSTWARIAPYVEEAMAKLSQKDREVIVLRYFDDRPLAEVGNTLGIKEDAARKRVERALDRLRSFFARRGVLIPAITLGSLLSANAVQAAPATLGVTVAKAALLKGAVCAASTLAIVKGTLDAMLWIKLKATGWAAGRLLLAAGIVVGTANEIQDYRLSKQDPAKPFRDFLEQQPDIKRIEFSVDPRLFHHVTQPEQPEPVVSSPRGMVHFVGGKQGDSFYIRQVNDSSVQATVFASDGPSGKSKDYYWTINIRNQVVISTSRDDNRIEGFVGVHASRLWRMLTLQIPFLKYGTLHWVNATNFTAMSLQDRKMQGRIVQFYGNGLPKRLECEIEGDSPDTIRGVDFEYDPEKMPPGIPLRFYHSGSVNGKRYQSPYREQLDTLDLGRDALSEQGYVPADFLQFASAAGGPVRYRTTPTQLVHAVAAQLYSASRGELCAGAGVLLVLVVGFYGLRRAVVQERD